MALESYDWPGNVRELENVIERAVIVCSGEHISGEDLSTCLAPPEAAPKDDLGMAFMKPYKEAKHEVLADFNQRYISYALAKSGGNVSEAAKEIGLQRQQLHRLIKDYDIQAGKFRDKPGG
jgi:DNA-binding NtrC family response regulator